MMKTEILGVIAQIVLMVTLSYPLGKYIAKVYKKEKTWLDFMKPVERLMFRLSDVDVRIKGQVPLADQKNHPPYETEQIYGQ